MEAQRHFYRELLAQSAPRKESVFDGDSNDKRRHMQNIKSTLSTQGAMDWGIVREVVASGMMTEEKVCHMIAYLKIKSDVC